MLFEPKPKTLKEYTAWAQVEERKHNYKTLMSKGK